MGGLFGGKSTTQEKVTNEESEHLERLPVGTVISTGILLSGDVTGNDSVTILGELQGTLKINGCLTVENTGKMVGPVEAEVVVVDGTITGDVYAKNMLIIRTGGEVTGEIKAKALKIEEGGRFNGKCKMLTDEDEQEEDQRESQEDVQEEKVEDTQEVKDEPSESSEEAQDADTEIVDK